MACELYWSPCIDKFHQVNQFLEENKGQMFKQTKRKSDIKVYLLDL